MIINGACWLDVTGSGILGSPMSIAEEICRSVREELGLTVSIGVSFNKIFAKLGSDMKKTDAITESPGLISSSRNDINGTGMSEHYVSVL